MRRISGEGSFVLGAIMEEEEEDEEVMYENVELGHGDVEGCGDETGGYLSCEE
jgi:hypothetical protein